MPDDVVKQRFYVRWIETNVFAVMTKTFDSNGDQTNDSAIINIFMSSDGSSDEADRYAEHLNKAVASFFNGTN